MVCSFVSVWFGAEKGLLPCLLEPSHLQPMFSLSDSLKKKKPDGSPVSAECSKEGEEKGTRTKRGFARKNIVKEKQKAYSRWRQWRRTCVNRTHARLKCSTMYTKRQTLCDKRKY